MKSDLVFFDLTILGQVVFHKIALDLNDSVAKYQNGNAHLAMMFLGDAVMDKMELPESFKPVEAIQFSFYNDNNPDEPEKDKDEVGRLNHLVNMSMIQSDELKRIVIQIIVEALQSCVELVIYHKWDEEERAYHVHYTMDCYSLRKDVDIKQYVNDPLYQYTRDTMVESARAILERTHVGHWADDEEDNDDSD